MRVLVAETSKLLGARPFARLSNPPPEDSRVARFLLLLLLLLLHFLLLLLRPGDSRHRLARESVKTVVGRPGPIHVVSLAASKDCEKREKEMSTFHVLDRRTNTPGRLVAKNDSEGETWRLTLCCAPQANGGRPSSSSLKAPLLLRTRATPPPSSLKTDEPPTANDEEEGSEGGASGPVVVVCQKSTGIRVEWEVERTPSLRFCLAPGDELWAASDEDHVVWVAW